MAKMENVIHCDLAIIGAGAAGLSLAAVAAQLGVKVVLLEHGKMGGDCLNYGCVPSKSLLAAAKAFWQATHAQHLGVYAQGVHLNFEKVMQHVRQVIDTIAPNDSVTRFTALGVQIVLSTARFIDKQTIAAGDCLIRSKRIVIATGSSPFIPSITGIDDVKYYTNETIFTLKKLPEHLLVIGGGPIGCELAQAFSMLGSTVTILESAAILPKDEPDCVDIVRKGLVKTGAAIYEGVVVKSLATKGDDIIIQFEKETKSMVVRGSHVLIATGRQANIRSLDLEKAGVDYTPKGIVVDSRLRTGNKKIYAIGDVASAMQFTHVASYQAGIVLKNILFRLPAKNSYRAVPWVTYTSPQLAHVGLSSSQAKSEGINIISSESLFADNDRAQTEGETEGKIKVYTDKKGRILGATIVGSKADDLIYPWVIAINEKKTLRSFTDSIAPYPTFSEASKRVASQFYAKKLFSDTMRMIVRWLLKIL